MTTNNSASPTTVRWDDPDGSWWIIAWDPDRGRYEATKLTHGDDGEERIVDDVGFGERRITTVDELAARMHRNPPLIRPGRGLPRPLDQVGMAGRRRSRRVVTLRWRPRRTPSIPKMRIRRAT